METILKNLKFGNISNKKVDNIQKRINTNQIDKSKINEDNKIYIENKTNKTLNLEKIDEINQDQDIPSTKDMTNNNSSFVYTDNSDLFNKLNDINKKIKFFNKKIKIITLKHKNESKINQITRKEERKKSLNKEDDINIKLTKYKLNIKNNIKMFDSLKEDLFKNLNLEIKSYSNFENDDIIPLCNFKEIQNKCEFSDYFSEIINQNYKFKVPSPIQSCVIPFILGSNNLIATSSTGSGKTMAYLLPIFSKLLKDKTSNKKALIVLPTKELCRQIYNDFSYFSSIYCNSKVKSKIIIKDLLNAISNESEYESFLNNTNVFIGTPENILNLLNKELNTKKLLKSIGFLVLDEADKMFEENSFNNSVQEIINIIINFERKLMKKIEKTNSENERLLHKLVNSKKIVKAFFSATMTEQIIEYLKSVIIDLKVISIGNFQLPCSNVNQTFKYCTNNQGKIFELKTFLMNKFSPPALVFVDDLETASKLFELIKYEVPKVDLLHGKLDNVKREEIIKKLRVHDIWVLITSDLISRGLDFKNINTVINFDCPENYVTYIHRVGRTGRAGRSGFSFTYITDDDRYKLKNLKKILQNSENISCPDWMKNVK